MLANVTRHAERTLTVKTMSLTIYSMSPEDIRRKDLGKEVCSLLRCRHVDQLYLLSSYLVADPVVLDVDVLGALVMHWIHGKLSTGLVVDIHLCRARVLHVDIPEELSHPHDILDGEEEREVLSLHGRHSHDRLELDIQLTGPPAIMMSTPEVDRRVSLSLPHLTA